jgi:hypothetical protein
LSLTFFLTLVHSHFFLHEVFRSADVCHALSDDDSLMFFLVS